MRRASSTIRPTSTRHQPTARTATRRHPSAIHTASRNSPIASSGSTIGETPDGLRDVLRGLQLRGAQDHDVAGGRRQLHAELRFGRAPRHSAARTGHLRLHGGELFLEPHLRGELFEQRVQPQHHLAVFGGDRLAAPAEDPQQLLLGRPVGETPRLLHLAGGEHGGRELDRQRAAAPRLRERRAPTLPMAAPS